MERLLIIGARGHARAVTDVVRAQGRHEIVGYIDSFQPAGTPCLGLAVLGAEENVPALVAAHGVERLFVAIGDNFQRAAMAQRLRARLPSARFATCIHPSAIVGSDVTIGDGTVVMPGAIVVGGTTIGEGCILNTGCRIDHDGAMGDWASLGPGVVAGGHVRVGARTAVGLGAKLINAIAIGEDTLIGAGALVLADVPSAVVAHGSPCRTVRSRAPDERYL